MAELAELAAGTGQSATASTSAPGRSVPACSASQKPSPVALHHPLRDIDIAAGQTGLLTVIITTSPTPSVPSTDLLSAVLASFRAHCPTLLACPVIVVFDTYDRIVSRARLKKGSVTANEARCYGDYKANVRQLVMRAWNVPEASLDPSCAVVEVGQAEYGALSTANNSVAFTMTRTLDRRVAFIEPAIRLGFGLAVRTALRAASTPYVWVQQHDWTLAASIPLDDMLHVMQLSETEREMATAKAEAEAEAEAEESDTTVVSGKVAAGTIPPGTASLTAGSESDSPCTASGDHSTDSNEALASLDSVEAGPPRLCSASTAIAVASTAPVRYICLPSIRMLRYAGSSHVTTFPNLRSLTLALKRDFPTWRCPGGESNGGRASGNASRAPDATGILPLTPLFFWHDKTHVALRSHYLERVFSSRIALGRGDFIEDHIGQRARSQMKQDPAAFRYWACWLYYPDNGNQLCLRHLQGRTWRGEDVEKQMRDMYKQRNRSAASAASAIAVEAAGGAAGQAAEKVAEAEQPEKSEQAH